MSYKSKYSPVGPIQLLEELHYKHGLLPGYQLFLAQDVLEHRGRFERLAFDMREDCDETFFIMDNGVIELGAPVPIEDLLEAAGIIEADCVVSPDVIGDFQETKKLAMTHGDTIREDYRLMMVPQGDDLVELCKCSDWLAERFPTDETPYLWGIPRWVANELGTRISLITYIQQYYPHSNIHLLGMSNNTVDDISAARNACVMGIDSANPLTLGMLGEHMGVEMHLPRGDLWERELLDIQMISNVRWMHNVLAGA